MNGNAVIFIIAAFSLGLLIILKKDSIQPKLRRGLAIAAILMIMFAFFLIVYSFFNLGSTGKG